jgi:hypothetical protein
MVESVGTQSFLSHRAHFADDRMAGSVPVWNHGTKEPSEDRVQNANALIGSDKNVKKAPAPSLSFGELLDVVNPLHHLPVVGGVYRHITGDEISSVARIVGGGLYGGGIGVAASLVNAAMEEHSGKDLVGNILDAGKPTTIFTPVEESRTAGLSVKAEEAPVEAVRIAEVIEKPAQAPLKQAVDTNDIIESLPPQKPITKIVMAEKMPPSEQRWHFNT